MERDIDGLEFGGKGETWLNADLQTREGFLRNLMFLSFSWKEGGGGGERIKIPLQSCLQSRA